VSQRQVQEYLEDIWEAVQEDVPQLKAMISQVLRDMENLL
jgi:uncharacterized protein with HEPN domain